MIEQISLIRILKAAVPFVITGIALSAAEVAIDSWPFWAMLVALIIASYTDYNDMKDSEDEAD
jgi:fatty acid desaturase